MNPFAILQFPTGILLYKGTIYLLSAVVSLVIALVIFSLLNQFKILQDNKWIKPFAQAYLVLAVMYSVRFLIWLLFPPSLPENVTFVNSATTAICSSLSSYFFFAVGFSLARKSRKISSNILKFLHINEGIAQYIVFVFLFLVALIATTGGQLARIPDILVSMSSLAFVGIALYRNLRRSRWMAWLALLAAIAYATLHIPYGLNPWIASDVGVGDTIDLIVFSLALPLKFGLFFPGYALMLMIANPSVGVRRLLKSVTHESAEFLKNDGVVLSIKEEIKASRAELYIKLPGAERNKVARYSSDKKAVDDPEEIPFDEDTDYGHVMSTREEILFRLINYSDQVPEFLQDTLSQRSSLIAVPVLFHNVIIGCLKVELDDGKFTEADMQNIQRLAAMVSPSAQDYREVNALNEISGCLTRDQLEAKGYQIEEDIKRTARIIHDIFAPLATGVYIEAGFCHYTAPVPECEPYSSMINRQLNSRDSGIFSVSENENLNWLSKTLKIKGDLGKFILATYKTDPPILATNILQRKVVSNLLTEALLNLIRGYLGEVNKKLGVSLGGLGVSLRGSSNASVTDWFQIIEEEAKEAHLLWAVASQPGNHELLGKEAGLVQELERNGRWEKKGAYSDTSKPDIFLCKIESPRGATSHVIRIFLRDSKHTIWVGVGNPDFKIELDYLSPWAAFVLRFGEIADKALQRIIDRQEWIKFLKEAAEVHGVATAAITTGTVIHQMVNQVRDLTGPLTVLEEGIKYGTLKGNETHRKLILSLGMSSRQIEELAKLFAGVTKPDERRPCSLNEAVQYAFDFLRDSLTRYNIRFDLQVPSEHIIDVPFYVAAFALANLLNNAKDAIRDGKVKDGLIEVRTEDAPTEKMILCHVTDNGPGVPPRLIGQLFKSSGKSGKPYGTGLGLYLSAHSLRESGGDIKITHPGPNPHTTLSVCFPKKRED